MESLKASLNEKGENSLASANTLDAIRITPAEISQLINNQVE